MKCQQNILLDMVDYKIFTLGFTDAKSYNVDKNTSVLFQEALLTFCHAPTMQSEENCQQNH